MGQVCGNVNRNLKWSFVETGNLIVNQSASAGGKLMWCGCINESIVARISRSPGGHWAPLGRSSFVGCSPSRRSIASHKIGGSRLFVDARVSAYVSLALEAE